MVSGKSKRVNPHPNRIKMYTLTYTILWEWRQGSLQEWRRTTPHRIKSHNTNSPEKLTPDPRLGPATKSIPITPKKRTDTTNSHTRAHITTTQYAQIPFLQDKFTCWTIIDESSTGAPCGNVSSKKAPKYLWSCNENEDGRTNCPA